METFEEVIARLSTVAENPLAEAIAADIRAGYAHDISVREAAIADREAKIAAAEKLVADKDQEALKLRAANYDLLMRVAPPKEPNADAPQDDDDKPRGINSLFE